MNFSPVTYASNGLSKENAENSIKTFIVKKNNEIDSLKNT